MRLCERGLAYKQIADRLTISFSTVRTHAAHVRQKLGAATMCQASALHRGGD